MKPTGRQSEIISLIAQGLSSREIAKELHISVDTVKTHRKELMKLYKARNCGHLVALWAEKQKKQMI